MGVPSPCVSPRVGDPAFTHMKRLECVGALLFLPRLLACYSPERVFQQIYWYLSTFHHTKCVFRHHHLLRGVMGGGYAVRNLGSTVPVSPCIQDLRNYGLHAFSHLPLSRHALVLFEFPRQVSRYPRGCFSSLPLPCFAGISYGSKRRT